MENSLLPRRKSSSVNSNSKSENKKNELADLSFSELSEWPDFAELHLAQAIYLNDNLLRALELKNTFYPKLETLSLANNKLTADALFPLRNLKSLRHLYLNGNRLRYINSAILCLQGLETLSLSDNLLSAIPGELTRLSRLRVLSLARNRLSKLPVETLNALENLELLSIHGNPLSFESQLEFIHAASTSLKVISISTFTNNYADIPSPPSSPILMPTLNNTHNSLNNNTLSMYDNLTRENVGEGGKFAGEGLVLSPVDADADEFDEFDAQFYLNNAPVPPPSLLEPLNEESLFF